MILTLVAPGREDICQGLLEKCGKMAVTCSRLKAEFVAF